jgi:hypothetical protein
VTRRPRGPGLVYLVLSVVMLVLLGVVAFTATQPPPPTIAEFAPNAVQNIKNAPDEQRSSQGGAGGCATGQPPCTTPTPSPPPKGAEAAAQQAIDVPRVRHCVGDPPRQIEDPQSPPCVPYWQGDNGGATYKGVTRDEIRIGAPSSLEDIADAARFFNKRFEFYGRKLVVIDDSGQTDCTDAVSGRSSAQIADEQFHLFATNQPCGSSAAEIGFTDEIARRGIIYVAHESPLGTDWMRRHHPYLWQYPMEADAMFAHLGEWTCKRLVGRPARFAGDPTFKSKTRVFGVLLQAQQTSDAPLKTTVLTDRLRQCGVTPKVVSNNPGTDGIANVMLQMKSSGVTSVLCLCHMLDEQNIGAAATAEGYFPEWLQTSYDLNHNNFDEHSGFPAEQRAHLFGLMMVPMGLAVADTPGQWACNEVGCQPGNDMASVTSGYNSMLLIASGIQMAGPHLTPETFAEGLRRTVFPNPITPAAAGRVGFNEPLLPPNPKYSDEANMSHSMTIDSIEFWWSETASDPDPQGGSGAMCYVSRKRYRLREYTAGSDDMFFNGHCDHGGV